MLQLLYTALWLAAPGPFVDIPGDLPDTRPPVTAATLVDVRAVQDTGRRFVLPTKAQGIRGQIHRLEYDARSDRFFVVQRQASSRTTASTSEVVVSNRPPARVTFASPEHMFEIPSVLFDSESDRDYNIFVYRVHTTKDGLLIGAFRYWRFASDDGNHIPMRMFRQGPSGHWTTTLVSQSDEAVVLDDASVLFPRARGRARDSQGETFRGPYRITLGEQRVPFPQQLRSLSQGSHSQLWGIRHRAFRDLLVETSKDGLVSYAARLPRGWRAFRPMPFVRGACVVTHKRDAEALECHHSPDGRRFTTSTSAGSTYLTDTEGEVFVGTLREVIAYASDGHVKWRIATALRSNLVATPQGELCWMEEYTSHDSSSSSSSSSSSNSSNSSVTSTLGIRCLDVPGRDRNGL